MTLKIIIFIILYNNCNNNFIIKHFLKNPLKVNILNFEEFTIL